MADFGKMDAATGNVWYPSALVRLTLVPEEFGQPADYLDAEIMDSSKVAGTTPEDRLARMSSPGFGRKTKTIDVVPEHVEIEMNGYRAADTCTVKIPFRNLPVDPRMARACLVQVFLGTVEARDFSAGNRNWVAEGRPAASGTPSLVKAYGMQGVQNLRFVGYVDEWHVKYDDDGDTISLKMRDFTGVMLDIELAAEVLKTVNYNQTLDRVVRDILKLHKSTANMAVEPETASSDTTIPTARNPADTPRVMLGKDGKSPKVPPPMADSIKMWDLVADVCNKSAGWIAYVDLDRVVIRPPNAPVPDSKNTLQQPLSAFRRVIPGYESLGETSIRVVVYGKNIEKLELERKMAGFPPTGVSIVSYDCDSRTRIVGSFPSAADLKAKGSPQKSTGVKVKSAGKVGEVTYRTFFYPGLRSEKAAYEIARQVYEQMGLQELQGSLQTQDLASLGGDNTDPDILSLKSGDAIRILVAPGDTNRDRRLISQMNDLAKKGRSELAAFLVGLGFGADIADVIAEKWKQKDQFASVFYVRNVRHTFDAGDGYSCSMDFVNYIPVRSKFP